MTIVKGQPLAPDQALQALEQTHADKLPRRRQQIAVGVALGYRAHELADLLGLGTATVFRHIDLTGAAVFEGTALDHNRGLLASWAVMHRECCLAAAWDDVLSGDLFQ